MKDLENNIKDLKAGRTLAQLKIEDKKAYYRVKSMASELSELKAQTNGNFISKEDLIEYKGLIIWLMKNKTNYQGHLNLKEAMSSLLSRIEKSQIVYKTKKGIKGIVADLAIREGLNNSESNLREANGFSVLDNTYGNSILESFQSFRLNALMN